MTNCSDAIGATLVKWHLLELHCILLWPCDTCIVNAYIAWWLCRGQW